MSSALKNILVHITFSTKYRKQLIIPEVEHRVYQYIRKVCTTLKCPLISIGGVEDHIHLLISLSTTMTISEFISKVKANSSRFIKPLDPRCAKFAWQKGYGAFSLGESARPQAIKYIANQKKHHKKISFQEEFLKLLKKYQIQYQEETIWD